MSKKKQQQRQRQQHIMQHLLLATQHFLLARCLFSRRTGAQQQQYQQMTSGATLLPHCRLAVVAVASWPKLAAFYLQLFCSALYFVLAIGITWPRLSVLVRALYQFPGHLRVPALVPGCKF